MNDPTNGSKGEELNEDNFMTLYQALIEEETKRAPALLARFKERLAEGTVASEVEDLAPRL